MQHRAPPSPSADWLSVSHLALPFFYSSSQYNNNHSDKMILDYSVYYPFKNLICVVWQLSDRYNHNNDEFLVTDIKDLMNHLDLFSRARKDFCKGGALQLHPDGGNAYSPRRRCATSLRMLRLLCHQFGLTKLRHIALLLTCNLTARIYRPAEILVFEWIVVMLVFIIHSKNNNSSAGVVYSVRTGTCSCFRPSPNYSSPFKII